MHFWFSFFFDLYQPLAFPMAFCSVNWTVLVAIFCTSGVDALFYYMGLIIAGYFKVLQMRMESLHEFNRRNLKDLVCQHIEIIKLAKLLPKCFSVVFYGQFLYSASMISFLGFQIATVSYRISFP